ncbi:hypothetical protein [Streptomyces sp. NPDC058872]|uniref:hypothetical protein n=1 Tax=Streptomyces sp. NPDC058872 TaxID=3346661 RepID=UPI00369E3056
MPRKTRHRVVREAEPATRRGRRTPGGDPSSGRGGTRQRFPEAPVGRPGRPVQTVRVSALFL